MSLRFSSPFMEKELKDSTTITYNSFKNNIKEVYNEYGFVVVTDILSDAEIASAESLLYEDLMESLDKESIKNKDLQKVVKEVESGKLHWPKQSIPGIPKKGFMSTPRPATRKICMESSIEYKSKRNISVSPQRQ